MYIMTLNGYQVCWTPEVRAATGQAMEAFVDLKEHAIPASWDP